MLEVSGLTKIFKNGNQDLVAVNNASFQVNKGEVALFIGPSGSGKTTLLTLLGGLAKPTSGTINIFGQEITALGGNALANFRLTRLGFIFQNFKLLKSLNTEENVMAPLCCLGTMSHHKSLATAREMLVSLGLQERLRYPVEKLSGGEKQRVAIARALINNPDLILADEPTASLDSKTGKTVSELLRNIAKSFNRTILIVSHDPRLVPIADRIFKVEDGVVKEETA